MMIIGEAVNVLAEAAAALRSKALSEGLDDGRSMRWTAHPAHDPDNNGWVVAYDWEADYDSTLARLPHDYDGHLARHLALIGHPDVALALADSFEQAAKVLVDAESGPYSMAVMALVEPLIKVARTYDGRD